MRFFSSRDMRVIFLAGWLVAGLAGLVPVGCGGGDSDRDAARVGQGSVGTESSAARGSNAVSTQSTGLAEAPLDGSSSPSGAPGSDQADSRVDGSAVGPAVGPGARGAQDGPLSGLSSAQLRSLQAHLKRGSFRAKSGEWVEAIAEFRQAVAIAPGVGDAHYLLGWALCGAGSQQDFPGALKEFDKALECGLHGPRISLGRAQALSELDRYSEALAQLEQLLDGPARSSGGPSDTLPSAQPPGIRVRGLLLRAKISLRRNDLEQAAADLAEVERLFGEDRTGVLAPYRVTLRMNKGLLAKARREWTEAATEFRSVVESNPEDREARYQLSVILERAGNKKEAARQREIHSLFVDAQDSIATKDRSNTARLAPIYARLKTLLPDYDRAYARMVRAYLLARQYAEGIQEATAGLEAIPDTPAKVRVRAELYYLMGNCQSKLGEQAATIGDKRAHLNAAAGCYREAGRLQRGFAPRAQEFIRQIEQTLRNLNRQG